MPSWPVQATQPRRHTEHSVTQIMWEDFINDLHLQPQMYQTQIYPLPEYRFVVLSGPHFPLLMRYMKLTSLKNLPPLNV